MKQSHLLALCLFILTIRCTPSDTQNSQLKFSVLFTKEMNDQAQDGRLLLLLANNNKSEPRHQISDGLNTQLVFGLDVVGMKPGDVVVVDATAFGHPIQHLGNVPAGEYFVQALLNRYETFTLKTGHNSPQRFCDDIQTIFLFYLMLKCWTTSQSFPHAGLSL